jgi:transcription initiation factor TFIID subunit TAF12
VRIFDLLKELRDQGVLTNLVRAGLIGSKAVVYFEMTEQFEEEVRRKPNVPKTIVTANVAERFKVEVTTVYRARKIMLSNLQQSAT